MSVLGAMALVTAGSIWASPGGAQEAPVHTAALIQEGDELPGEGGEEFHSGIDRRPGFDSDFGGPVNPDNGPGLYVDGTTEPPQD